MEPWIRWITVPALIAAAPAYAAQYLTVEQAQQSLFPSSTRLTPYPLELNAEQKQAIVQVSGVRVRDIKPMVWRAFTGERPAGWFFIDQVIGKHEFITYALALDPDGAVRGIEVMDYRETYGYEIRNAEWRRQFVGKHNGDAFKLGGDIQNVTGATLSCRNVTNGVKRLLAMHAAVLK
jgi:Na+-translocating ferredoxin:NAD+ oxidoreductase RnfG subunit